MIASRHITSAKIARTVNTQAVAHGHAHRIRYEDRHPALGLSNEFSMDAGDADGVILVFAGVAG